MLGLSVVGNILFLFCSLVTLVELINLQHSVGVVALYSLKVFWGNGGWLEDWDQNLRTFEGKDFIQCCWEKKRNGLFHSLISHVNSLKHSSCEPRPWGSHGWFGSSNQCATRILQDYVVCLCTSYICVFGCILVVCLSSPCQIPIEREGIPHAISDWVAIIGSAISHCINDNLSFNWALIPAVWKFNSRNGGFLASQQSGDIADEYWNIRGILLAVAFKSYTGTTIDRLNTLTWLNLKPMQIFNGTQFIIQQCAKCLVFAPCTSSMSRNLNILKYI